MSFFDAVMDSIGAERFVGPPPPCVKERVLKQQIQKTRAALGKPRTRGGR